MSSTSSGRFAGPTRSVRIARLDWLCSDVIAYPDRLLRLVRRWVEAGAAGTIVCTVKLQGRTDHEAVAGFAALPGARLVHLHHNRHELTCIVTRTG